MKYLLILAACSVAVVADIAFVYAAKSTERQWAYFASAIICMNIAAGLWVASMRLGLSTAFAIAAYAILTVAGCSLIGFLRFGETLSPLKIGALGVALGCLAILGVEKTEG